MSEESPENLLQRALEADTEEEAEELLLRAQEADDGDDVSDLAEEIGLDDDPS